MKDMVLKAQNTALVIVDMENEFCKPWGKYYIGPEVEAVIHNNEYIPVSYTHLTLPTN